MFENLISFVKSLYPNQNPIPLHTPIFWGNEKKYLSECIDSTYVSYVGRFVSQFEEMTANYCSTKYAIAVVNGTTALHIALRIAGVNSDDEVITQPLTFVATANAISHCGAQPIFIDVDKETMGLSPEKLSDWLNKNTYFDSDQKKQINKSTHKPISAIVPMHTFGFACKIDIILKIATEFNIPVIEDAAESLGTFYKNKHTGTFGLAGILSYNGNKTITTGGGGMIITDNHDFAMKAIHITKTAKVPHSWEFIHDEVGYNYRLPNINAAVGVAQMEKLDEILKNKKDTANKYHDFFIQNDIDFIKENKDTIANYWLNCILLKNREERDSFLDLSNRLGVTTRPIWRLMNKLEMYKNCQTGNLDNAIWFEDRIVNIPSGYRLK